VDVETRYFIILLKLIFKSECFGRGAIAEIGSTKQFPFTAFLMRPSVLYVGTVSDFLNSSRTTSYGLERGVGRNEFFHFFPLTKGSETLITDCDGLTAFKWIWLPRFCL
jgi:hypothetical protein